MDFTAELSDVRLVASGDGVGHIPIIQQLEERTKWYAAQIKAM